MSTEKTIPLTFNKEEFEKIYNLREHGNIFRNRYTRSYVLTAAVLGAGFAISLTYAYYSNELAFLPVILLIGLLFALVGLFVTARPYVKWKRSVIRLIKETGRYKDQKLILTDYSLVLIQDQTKTIEKWSAISRVKIEPNYLSIDGVEYFIFPRSAMIEDDFEYLKAFVSKIMTVGQFS